MSTFLELTQLLAREVGIPGTGPTTVTSQTGELADIVQYIIDADMDIKRRWNDWKFMWTSTTDTTTVGQNTLTTGNPSDLGMWNRDSVVYDYDTEDYVYLDYMDWEEWKNIYKFGTQSNATPEVFTLTPDTQAIQVGPKPDASKNLYLEYWKVPSELSADADVSIIPVEFHRLIVVRAKLYFAEHEDAPEILAGSTAEHEDLLVKLESKYGRKQEGRNLHQSFGAPMVEVI